jgi:hypothetical protein
LAYRILVGRSEGKRPLGRPGIDGRIILNWIFKRWGGEAWTGLMIDVAQDRDRWQVLVNTVMRLWVS